MAERSARRRAGQARSINGRAVLIGIVLVLLMVFVALNRVGVRPASTGAAGYTSADPTNAEQVALGRQVYVANCASCHGVNLEGQRNWQAELPGGGRLAPPHDETGHTWHHPDDELFLITKNGGQPYSPSGYQNNMPAFGDRLSDGEIWAVLAYIKSTWPEDILAVQEEITREAR